MMKYSFFFCLLPLKTRSSSSEDNLIIIFFFILEVRIIPVQFELKEGLIKMMKNDSWPAFGFVSVFFCWLS